MTESRIARRCRAIRRDSTNPGEETPVGVTPGRRPVLAGSRQAHAAAGRSHGELPLQRRMWPRVRDRVRPASVRWGTPTKAFSDPPLTPWRQPWSGTGHGDGGARTAGHGEGRVAGHGERRAARHGAGQWAAGDVGGRPVSRGAITDSATYPQGRTSVELQGGGAPGRPTSPTPQDKAAARLRRESCR